MNILVDLLFLIINLFVYIFLALGIIYLGAFLIGLRTKKKREKELSELVKKKIKTICLAIIDFMLMGLAILLSTFLAISSKKLIFILNEPLGMEYANLASYGVAICLYVIFRGTMRIRNKEKLNG